MFLGRYAHTVDAKGRLAIPARFREELAAGVVLTRGIDRCLALYPMATWLPLSQFPAAGSADAPTPGVAIVSQNGLPWERRQEMGFLPAFFETLKLVLLNPSVAFASMRPEGGLADPLIYGVLGGSVGWLFYFIFSLFLGSLGTLGNHNALGGLVGLGLGGIFGLILVLVMLFKPEGLIPSSRQKAEFHEGVHDQPLYDL